MQLRYQTLISLFFSYIGHINICGNYKQRQVEHYKQLRILPALQVSCDSPKTVIFSLTLNPLTWKIW